MNKWYDEEYKFTIEVVGYLRGEKCENYCRNGEEIGDKYECTYGCPVNAQGYGICSKTMNMLYPIVPTRVPKTAIRRGKRHGIHANRVIRGTR